MLFAHGWSSSPFRGWELSELDCFDAFSYIVRHRQEHVHTMFYLDMAMYLQALWINNTTQCLWIIGIHHIDLNLTVFIRVNILIKVYIAQLSWDPSPNTSLLGLNWLNSKPNLHYKCKLGLHKMVRLLVKQINKHYFDIFITN